MKKRWKEWMVHDFPWSKYPLIAFAIVSIGPSVFAPTLYLWRFGSSPGDHLAEISTLLVAFPALFALVNWPFLALYFVCRRKVKEEWRSVRSVRLAMWISLVAMLLWNVLVLTTGILGEELIYPWSWIEAGNFFLLLVPLPILGLIGWVTGRLVAWIIGLVIGAT